MSAREYLDHLIHQHAYREKQFSTSDDEIAVSLVAAKMLAPLQGIAIPPEFAHRMELQIRACAHFYRTAQSEAPPSSGNELSQTTMKEETAIAENEFRRSISIDSVPGNSQCEWCEKPAAVQLTMIGSLSLNESGRFCSECGAKFVRTVAQTAAEDGLRS